MTTVTTLLALIAAGSAAAMESTASDAQGANQANQQQVQKLPEPAREVVLREARQHEARIKDIDEKDKNGAHYYKVALENPDRAWSLKVSDQGTIVEIDAEHTRWEELPQAVREQLLQEAKDGAMITHVEKTRRDGHLAYRADIEKDGRGQDIVVDASGRRLATMVAGTSSGSQTDERSSRGERTMQRAGEKTDRARERAADETDRTLDRAGDQIDRAGDKADHALDRAEDARRDR